MTPSVVIFDIGAVLVDWRPALAWSDDLGGEGAHAFLDRIGFDKLNFACDAGATFATAATMITDPEDAARLGQYVSRYRSEEHTSELQSRQYLVCRLLLEKKNTLLQFLPPRTDTLF